jgi:hypothetical protein
VQPFVDALQVSAHLLDKVKDLLSKNADKVDTAIDKAGDVVDRKYKGTVDKVEEEAKKFGIGE